MTSKGLDANQGLGLNQYTSWNARLESAAERATGRNSTRGAVLPRLELVVGSIIVTSSTNTRKSTNVLHKPFLDDCRKQKRIGIKLSQLIDSFGRGILFLYPFFVPELHKGGEDKTGFKKWSVARINVLCNLIHSSQSAFAKNLRLLGKAFEPFFQGLSNGLDIEGLLKVLDSQDLNPEGVEDSRGQHFSSDGDKLQELFNEFPGTSCVFYKSTSLNTGLTILQEDLQKFGEGSWLSDTVVNAVMHLYREKKPKDLYLLRSSNLEIFSCVFQSRQDRLSRTVSSGRRSSRHSGRAFQARQDRLS